MNGNLFGNNITLTVCGGSHSKSICAVLGGLPKGLDVDYGVITDCLTRRRPSGEYNTLRVEKDEFVIKSGVENGKTNGEPLEIEIKNNDVKSEEYEKYRTVPRPGHADFSQMQKYGEKANLAGGGLASGRLTALLVAAGAVLMPTLVKKGILIGTHLKQAGGIDDRDFCDYNTDINLLNTKNFAVLSEKSGKKMIKKALKAKKSGDSIGGILETAVTGVPAGVGEPWFNGTEGMLSHALFSIPAIKAVEFGTGFALAKMRGSTANDRFVKRGESVVTATNNNGGINGGITNGMPIIFRCAVKPTPTISKPQKTLNLQTGKEEILVCGGRHDALIANRARVAVDCVTALVIADLLAEQFGSDWLVS